MAAGPIGGDSPEYREAVAENADDDTFTRQLADLSRLLVEVYATTLPREEKIKRKAAIISAFQERLVAQAPTLSRPRATVQLGKISINNALLSLYRLYSSDVPLLRAYWERRCDSDLRKFMQAAQALARMGDVKAQMKAELGTS